MAEATIKFHPDGNENFLVDSSIVSQSTSKVVSVDPVDGYRYIFRGDDLTTDGTVINGGVIEDMIIKGPSDNPIMEIHGLEFDVSQLGADDMFGVAFASWFSTFFLDLEVTGNKTSEALVSYLGDDVVHGLGGDDILDANSGRDRLFGDGGSDTFVFDTGYGKDRIMDFDANGGPGMQDFLDCDPGAIVDKYRDGRNTVLDFGGGDVLVLVNVKPSEISEMDFLL